VGALAVGEVEVPAPAVGTPALDGAVDGDGAAAGDRAARIRDVEVRELGARGRAVVVLRARRMEFAVTWKTPPQPSCSRASTCRMCPPAKLTEETSRLGPDVVLVPTPPVATPPASATP
jgi:hypothetical protein